MKEIAQGFKDLHISQKKQDILVGVLAGGISCERAVSLKTGRNIIDSLSASGYSAIFIDPGQDGFIEKIKKIDIAFLALHGKYGEDGTVQGLLELLKVPYTGSGVLSSALLMDKTLSKKIMVKENIPTPEFFELLDQDLPGLVKDTDRRIRNGMGYPVVVKPNSSGSTIGISKVVDKAGLGSGIREAFTYDWRIMVEDYISGRELTVGVIGQDPVALPVIEIIPRSGFFDYESKYTKNMTEYIVPAKIGKGLTERIMGLSLTCHQLFGCCGVSRTDFILDGDGTPYVLELNTMPGMTSTSLVPMAAEAAGIGFHRLVEIILDSADLKIR